MLERNKETLIFWRLVKADQSETIILRSSCDTFKFQFLKFLVLHLDLSLLIEELVSQLGMYIRGLFSSLEVLYMLEMNGDNKWFTKQF